MSRLAQVNARGLMLLVEADESINAPFSLYLNERFDNPHTRDAAAASLRLLHRFLMAHRIDLLERALDNECLRSAERKWLAELAYRPLKEIESMSDKMITRLTMLSRSTVAIDKAGAVAPNTAAMRLAWVADFLEWYRTDLLSEAIRSASDQQALNDRYATALNDLKRRIRGTPQGHHNQIRSLPVERYLRIIRELVVNPESLFLTRHGARSSTMMRDRAMALLAAEGLRTGSLGNLTIDDFKYRAGDTAGYVAIRDNAARRQAPLRTSTPKAKGARSTLVPYNSNITIKLWPFTCQAIKQYIDEERATVVGRRLKNRSKSFLFIADHGGPIADRTTIAFVFSRLAERLQQLGFLDTAKGDAFARGSYYTFTAYTLRHSAAAFFYKTHAHEPAVLDLMRQRFGWSAASNMPDRYARRAMSEAASLNMIEFHEELLQAIAARRKQQQEQAHGRA